MGKKLIAHLSASPTFFLKESLLLLFSYYYVMCTFSLLMYSTRACVSYLCMQMMGASCVDAAPAGEGGRHWISAEHDAACQSRAAAARPVPSSQQAPSSKKPRVEQRCSASTTIVPSFKVLLLLRRLSADLLVSTSRVV